MKLEALTHNASEIAKENAVEISSSMMTRALERRRAERLPVTPTLVARRNNIAQTRQLIEQRQREIELQLRVLETEQRNLQLAYDETTEEWDFLWARGLP